MRVVHAAPDPTGAGHDPAFFLVRGRVAASAERPERARVLLEAALRAGLEPHPAAPASRADLLAVHTAGYLDFLEGAAAEWAALPGGAGPEVVANVHPAARGTGPAAYPRSLVGRAGWHMADAACPIGPGTFEAALGSAGAALEGARILLAGEGAAYALCRPPGHHAYPDMAGGFCFLNNAALAAERLRAGGHARVAVLDLDVHHGNGTQGTFWERGDVIAVSVHADPADFYPFYWGHAHERGAGPGEGANFNLPLPVGTGDAEWLAAVEAGVLATRRFGATALVVALGLDPHEADPLQGMRVTERGFAAAGALVRGAATPTLIVQEGGYLSPRLGPAFEAFLSGFAAAG